MPLGDLISTVPGTHQKLTPWVITDSKLVKAPQPVGIENSTSMPHAAPLAVNSRVNERERI